MDPEDTYNDGAAYGAQPLKGLAEFEVKIVSYYGSAWGVSIYVGVMQCERGLSIESGPGIPEDSYVADYHCVWIEAKLMLKNSNLWQESQ